VREGEIECVCERGKIGRQRERGREKEEKGEGEGEKDREENSEREGHLNYSLREIPVYALHIERDLYPTLRDPETFIDTTQHPVLSARVHATEVPRP